MPVPGGQVERGELLPGQVQHLRAVGDEEVDGVQVAVLGGQVQGGFRLDVQEEGVCVALRGGGQGVG